MNRRPSTYKDAALPTELLNRIRREADFNGLLLGKGEGDTGPKEAQLVNYRAIKDPRICHI